MKWSKYIPFSYLWILRRSIGSNVKTVLDLGCGDGKLMVDLARGENWRITGVELYGKSVEGARKTGVYEKVVKADVAKLPKEITSQKHDVVFSSQVLEHLPKSKGGSAINRWEKLAKLRVVVSTPYGFIEYDPLEVKEEKNSLQKHLSGWLPEEFTKRGYKIYGQGARFVYGKKGLARKVRAPLSFWSVVSFVFAPFVYFFPNLATYMVAWKEK